MDVGRDAGVVGPSVDVAAEDGGIARVGLGGNFVGEGVLEGEVGREVEDVVAGGVDRGVRGAGEDVGGDVGPCAGGGLVLDEIDGEFGGVVADWAVVTPEDVVGRSGTGGEGD